MYSSPNLEPVRCPVSGSDCCFLTCIQISQGAGQVAWYSHLFKNFPPFIVIHTVKGFSVINQWSRNRCFSGILLLFLWSRMLVVWSLIPLHFLNPSWTVCELWYRNTFYIHICQKMWFSCYLNNGETTVVILTDFLVDLLLKNIHNIFKK